MRRRPATCDTGREKQIAPDGVPGPVGPGALATNGLLHDEIVSRLAATEPTQRLDLAD